MNNPVLACNDLTIRYSGADTQIKGVTFDVRPGECFALVGRSGSGKSTITKAFLGLHHADTTISGEILFEGRELLKLSPKEWKQIRGVKIGYVAQNPWGACDPRRSVLDHMKEAWLCQGRIAERDHIISKLINVGVADAVGKIGDYPHQWSGGMLQRASISAATAHQPSLIIADEPTSALDFDLSRAVLSSIKRQSSAVLLVSHDMELVMQQADRVGILHNGELVEIISPASVKSPNHHPVTRCFLDAIQQSVPTIPKCRDKPIMRLEGVNIGYQKQSVPILRDVNLSIAPGEIVGILGPSGSGKSSLLKLVMGLLNASSGSIESSQSLKRPGAIMPIFQDPSGSLPLSWPIWRVVTEPLTAAHLKRTSRTRRRKIAKAALEKVGLGDLDIDIQAWELSVGQKQRVCLCRIELASPALIVADEPTSALDTIACQMVAKLLEQQANQGAAILLVSHNESFLERICHRRLRVDPTEQSLLPIENANIV